MAFDALYQLIAYVLLNSDQANMTEIADLLD
jgi:hypothetical protein